MLHPCAACKDKCTTPFTFRCTTGPTCKTVKGKTYKTRPALCHELVAYCPHPTHGARVKQACPITCKSGCSCSDGVQNGDEKGKDCGGSCAKACPTCKGAC